MCFLMCMSLIKIMDSAELFYILRCRYLFSLQVYLMRMRQIVLYTVVFNCLQRYIATTHTCLLAHIYMLCPSILCSKILVLLMCFMHVISYCQHLLSENGGNIALEHNLLFTSNRCSFSDICFFNLILNGCSAVISSTNPTRNLPWNYDITVLYQKVL